MSQGYWGAFEVETEEQGIVALYCRSEIGAKFQNFSPLLLILLTFVTLFLFDLLIFFFDLREDELNKIQAGHSGFENQR